MNFRAGVGELFSDVLAGSGDACPEGSCPPLWFYMLVEKARGVLFPPLVLAGYVVVAGNLRRAAEYPPFI
jgi:hypothetical protein